jgi:D-3-phosphoglycerate dehydrogenase
MFTVWVAEKSYPDYSIERSIVEAAGGTLRFARCRTEDDILRRCAGAHALLLRQAPVGETALRGLGELRVVSRYGSGCDNVDVEAATRHGVVVTAVDGYCAGEVADHAIALLLAVIRRIPLRDRLVRAGGWDLIHRAPVHRTDGGVLGFVGYGRTAREVRKRLSGFPFRFAAFDPFAPHGAFVADGTVPLDFGSLLEVSHYVSVHVPLTGLTRRLFDREAFARMRKGAVLVNTSRGGVVDLRALHEALRSGHLGGAALDVYETEPFDVSSPLASLDTVVLSDHASWYSEESLGELQRRAALEAVRVLRGEAPENPVNPAALGKKPPPGVRSGAPPGPDAPKALPTHELSAYHRGSKTAKAVDRKEAPFP